MLMKEHRSIEKMFSQLRQTVLQLFIYLKLSVAGHTVLLIARTKGHFWSIRPTYRSHCHAIDCYLDYRLWDITSCNGWSLALLVWGYVLLAFVITDFLKVRFYHLLNHQGIIFKRRIPANS